MAYRKETEVEFGFWAAIGSFLVSAGSIAIPAILQDAPKSLVAGVGRPEASMAPLFTQPVEVQQQINEILAKSAAKQEAVVAEEQAKKLTRLQPILWTALAVVAGIVIWKAIKKRKAK